MGVNARGLKFLRQGQSVELMWNSTAVNSSTGGYIIVGGMCYAYS